VETGRTLKENKLIEVAQIAPATARFIANRVSFKMKFNRIHQIVEKLKALTESEERACSK
jgi:ATP phosphoribosyltransferase